MNGEESEPIFIRHKDAPKSAYVPPERKQDPEYAQNHFRTIKVHEKFEQGDLKGKVVCLLDDYLNYGNTFESLRNLLVHCGVRKIICVAIGKFLRTGENMYSPKQFAIDGNVYSGAYSAQFTNTQFHAPQINHEGAEQIMKTLKSLIDSSRANETKDGRHRWNAVWDKETNKYYYCMA